MKRNNHKSINLPGVIAVVILLLIGACYQGITKGNDKPTVTASPEIISPEEVTDSTATPSPTQYEDESEPSDSTMKVHFIDCGQADSILIQSEGKNMLVDAGNNADGEMVVDYLEKNKVKKLDYVIGTHPHEDHIGGLDNVIEHFTIGKVIMPPKEATTKTFEDVLDALEEHNLSITKPVPGTKYKLGAAQFTILSPNADYGNQLNNWSVGIRLVNGKDSFVLCGDCEQEAENDICQSGLRLQADVLKLNHHGSRTASTDRFLQACSPKIVVIMCGAGNSFGHPHKETLDKIKKYGYKVYRTDVNKTIVAISSGNGITMKPEVK